MRHWSWATEMTGKSRTTKPHGEVGGKSVIPKREEGANEVPEYSNQGPEMVWLQLKGNRERDLNLGRSCFGSRTRPLTPLRFLEGAAYQWLEWVFPQPGCGASWSVCTDHSGAALGKMEVVQLRRLTGSSGPTPHQRRCSHHHHTVVCGLTLFLLGYLNTRGERRKKKKKK